MANQRTVHCGGALPSRQPNHSTISSVGPGTSRACVNFLRPVRVRIKRTPVTGPGSERDQIPYVFKWKRCYGCTACVFKAYRNDGAVGLSVTLNI